MKSVSISMPIELQYNNPLKPYTYSKERTEVRTVLSGSDSKWLYIAQAYWVKRIEREKVKVKRS